MKGGSKTNNMKQEGTIYSDWSKYKYIYNVSQKKRKKKKEKEKRRR